MKRWICALLALALTAACLCGVSFAAEPEARWTNGSVTKEGTLIKMNELCWQTGGTLTLLKDVFLADREAGRYALNFDSNVVFELNGHSVGTNGGGLLVTDGASACVVKDSAGGGMIFGMGGPAVKVNGAALTMENVALFSKTDYALHMNSDKKAVLSGCTLVSGLSSPMILNSGAAPRADLTGCLLLSGSGAPAVAGQAATTEIRAEDTRLCTAGTPLGSGVKISGRKPELLTESTSMELRGEKYETIPTYDLVEAPEEPEAPVTPTVPTSSNTPEELAIMQRALAETAYAYFRKNDRVQYDWKAMTIQDRRAIGISRLTTGDTPEMAAKDNIHFTHCSQFAYDVYWNTFHRAPADIIPRQVGVQYYNTLKPASDPDVVLKYGGTGGMTDKEEFVRLAKELLQPGDLLNVSQTNIELQHTMIYIGDVMGDGEHVVIHSSGSPSGRMDDANGVTVKKTTWDLFLSPSGGHSILKDENVEATIIRPLWNIDYSELLPAARTRLKYSLMDITRESSVFHYGAVEQGEEIEVTLTIRNGSTEAYKSLVVNDPAPTGAEILADSITEGGELADGGVQWVLNIPADSRVDLTYKIRVTARRGEEVLLPAGTVANIATRDLSWVVSGRAINESLMETASNAKTVEGLEGDTQTMELAFAKTFYKNALGIELDLPDTMNELIAGLFNQVQAPGAGKTGGLMLAPKAYEELDASWKSIRDMVIKDHITGQVVDLGLRPETMKPHDRVMTYFKEAYEPGDIFIVLNGDPTVKVTDPTDVTVYIISSNGKVITAAKNGIRTRNFDDTICLTLDSNVVVALRPIQAMDNINSISTMAPAEPEVPETPADPVTPEVPETPAEPTTPADPVEEKGGAPVGLIVGIATAVVFIAAVVVVVLKKKKK